MITREPYITLGKFSIHAVTCDVQRLADKTRLRADFFVSPLPGVNDAVSFSLTMELAPDVDNARIGSAMIGLVKVGVCHEVDEWMTLDGQPIGDKAPLHAHIDMYAEIKSG